MFKSKPKCPYCGEILENPPKTKKKCPNCKNPVYFIVDPYTNKKYYLTENDAEKINNLKDRYRVEEKFFNQFNEYGLTENHFKQRRNKFEKKPKLIKEILEQGRIKTEKRAKETLALVKQVMGMDYKI